MRVIPSLFFPSFCLHGVLQDVNRIDQGTAPGRLNAFLIPATGPIGEARLENFICDRLKNLKILEKICQGFCLTFLKNIVKNYWVLIDKKRKE